MTTTAETLYYQIYNSVLLGKTDDAKMYLHFLREEYDESPKKFEPLLEDDRWDHLKKLGNVIDNDLEVKNFEKIEECTETIIKQEDATKINNQTELVKSIGLAKEQLRTLIQAEEDFSIIDLEQETLYGRVDMVAQDKHTIYPIEVKTSMADHSVIYQVDKYIRSFKLGLLRKIYQQVVGIVIANNFLDYVLKELPRIGAVAISYKLKEDGFIELRRV